MTYQATQAVVVSLIPPSAGGWDCEAARNMTGDYTHAGHSLGHGYYVRKNGSNVFFDTYWGWCIGQQLNKDPEAWAIPLKDGAIPETGWKARGFMGWHDELPIRVLTVVNEVGPAAPISPGRSGSVRDLYHRMPETHHVIGCMSGCFQEVRGALSATSTPTSKPRAPCCVGVVRDTQGLRGREVIVATQPAYFAKPQQFSGVDSRNVGVLVIHDIFGINIPNGKYIVDHFAGQGFPALMPDFFTNKGLSRAGWPATEFDQDALDTPDFGTWWEEITSAAYWQAFGEQAGEAIAFLRANGCTTFAVVGFCWGGIGVEKLAGLGAFASASSIHGVHDNADGYLRAVASGCKELTYHTVPEDVMFPKTAIDALQKEGANVRIWDGMQHGFAVRGDFQNNSEQKKAADAALLSVVTQFGKLQASPPTAKKLADKPVAGRSDEKEIQEESLDQRCEQLFFQKSILETELSQLQQDSQLRETQTQQKLEASQRKQEDLEAASLIATQDVQQLLVEKQALTTQTAKATQLSSNAEKRISDLQAENSALKQSNKQQEEDIMNLTARTVEEITRLQAENDASKDTLRTEKGVVATDNELFAEFENRLANAVATIAELEQLLAGTQEKQLYTEQQAQLLNEEKALLLMQRDQQEAVYQSQLASLQTGDGERIAELETLVAKYTTHIADIERGDGSRIKELVMQIESLQASTSEAQVRGVECENQLGNTIVELEQAKHALAEYEDILQKRECLYQEQFAALQQESQTQLQEVQQGDSSSFQELAVQVEMLQQRLSEVHARNSELEQALANTKTADNAMENQSQVQVEMLQQDLLKQAESAHQLRSNLEEQVQINEQFQIDMQQYQQTESDLRTQIELNADLQNQLTARSQPESPVKLEAELQEVRGFNVSLQKRVADSTGLQERNVELESQLLEMDSLNVQMQEVLQDRETNLVQIENELQQAREVNADLQARSALQDTTVRSEMQGELALSDLARQLQGELEVQRDFSMQLQEELQISNEQVAQLQISNEQLSQGSTAEVFAELGRLEQVASEQAEMNQQTSGELQQEQATRAAEVAELQEYISLIQGENEALKTQLSQEATAAASRQASSAAPAVQYVNTVAAPVVEIDQVNAFGQVFERDFVQAAPAIEYVTAAPQSSQRVVAAKVPARTHAGGPVVKVMAQPGRAQVSGTVKTINAKVLPTGVSARPGVVRSPAVGAAGAAQSFRTRLG